MKKATTFIFLIITAITLAQNNILNDSTSSRGKIIQKLKKEGLASISFRNKSDAKKLQGYRVCEHFYEDINSLNKEINDEEIDTLFKSNNGTLKAISFIIFANRNNNKEIIKSKLNEVIKQDFTLMTKNCSDAISTYSLARFDYELLIKNNYFFKAKFKLNKKEKEKIENELKKNEVVN